MLPDFRTKATSKEHYLFKVQTEEQLRQAALEAGEDPGKLGGAPSRSLTLRPDEVPEENHMESLVLEGEEVVEIRQASKTSGCSTVPNASHASSGEDESGRPGRAGSKQSVGKKKGRSQSKLSRAGSKTSSCPDPHLQRSRSLSEGELHISKQVSAGQTLGDQLAFRSQFAIGMAVVTSCFLFFATFFEVQDLPPKTSVHFPCALCDSCMAIQHGFPP